MPDPHAAPGADPRPETVAATFCATLVDEWVRAGVTDAVVAPGSRSTPMALALTGDGRVRVHVHPDERSAGFVALGLGLASGRPAVVLTTSGTAAVELHPAVVEAHEAKVPMLVCTADRPPELHGVGAPQTIDQQHLYGTAARSYVDLGAPDPAMASAWRSLAAQAVARAQERPPGPVHVNLPLRDPLVGRPGPLPAGRDGQRPWHRRAQASTEVDPELLASLFEAARSRRGVIVAGGGIEDPAGVHALSRALGWPVLADPRSGCRRPESATISHFDAILRVPELARRLAPDVVLRLGSLPASKVLGQWLAGLDAWQVAIEWDGTRYDPDRTLDGMVAAPPGATAARLAAMGPDPDPGGSREGEGVDDWSGRWAHADAVAAEAIATTLSGHEEATEPGTARDVVRALPDGAALVVSSSMPVRDVEWYAAPHPDLAVFANRGANGIDGVVSTAVGVALARAATPGAGPTVALLGDLAFLHDTNGLLGLVRRRVDLTFVVVDNDGGGIFSFLPQAEGLDPARFEQLFGTPHGADLAALAGAHGVSARRIRQQREVTPAVVESISLGGAHVIVVPTDRTANVAIHAEIHAAVAAALTARPL